MFFYCLSCWLNLAQLISVCKQSLLFWFWGAGVQCILIWYDVPQACKVNTILLEGYRFGFGEAAGDDSSGGLLVGIFNETLSKYLPFRCSHATPGNVTDVWYSLNYSLRLLYKELNLEHLQVHDWCCFGGGGRQHKYNIFFKQRQNKESPGESRLEIPEILPVLPQWYFCFVLFLCSNGFYPLLRLTACSLGLLRLLSMISTHE